MTKFAALGSCLLCLLGNPPLGPTVHTHTYELCACKELFFFKHAHSTFHPILIRTHLNFSTRKRRQKRYRQTCELTIIISLSLKRDIGNHAKRKIAFSKSTVSV